MGPGISLRPPETLIGPPGMTEDKKKALMVYGLGAIVVIMTVGAAVAHVFFTNNANPLGAPAHSVKK